MNNYLPLSLYDVPVTIADPVLSVRLVKRTWKERLFTLPFTPLTKTKEVKTLTELIEDGKILKTAEGLIMNAKTFNDCEKAIFNKAVGE
jgi:hypothetical protein